MGEAESDAHAASVAAQTFRRDAPEPSGEPLPLNWGPTVAGFGMRPLARNGFA
ncbi:MAG: hypothetical protein ACXWP0_16325 [Ktedonobacterales bacterium]